MTESRSNLRRAQLQELSNFVDSLETATLPELLEPVLSIELTLQQLRVLLSIGTSEQGRTPTELSSAFDVSLPTISGILKRLAALDMTERVADPADMRRRTTVITERGREVLGRLVSRRSAFSRDVLALMSDEDIAALAQGVRAVQRAREQLASR
ncbi:MarR family winged helix-turn-helix transcriptional regulator [Microbacterium sp.]|uniref:MarR family winged helix-turn-helix transcriptional regulator n=1 Tax=Microbacterium sp. TaxID=51671 RepID=UPI002735588C|nr:MarR family transcriptional regulator [Microbacterium sp.]MDP3949419.1 MarR family transcriptional regulator [Microbacterium sp.]